MKSPQLKEFYVEQQAWIDAGCPLSGPFSTKFGMCMNVIVWRDIKRNEGREDVEHVGNELHAQFAALGSEAYPFNRDDRDTYWQEKWADKLWANPERLAWAKKHAEA